MAPRMHGGGAQVPATPHHSSTAEALPRNVAILAAGIGVSRIGDLVYLVAINILVLEITHSPVAVAGLWMMSRIAALIVGPWAGSLTDRLSPRGQLIGLDVARAALIAVMPLLHHMALIYLDLFVLGVGSTFFANVFLPYQSRLVPEQHRKHANAIMATLRSSGILIGPAIAGLMLEHGDTTAAILGGFAQLPPVRAVVRAAAVDRSARTAQIHPTTWGQACIAGPKSRLAERL